jgi:hypothetical protein
MATAQNSNSGPSTVFDDSELARMVQARFPALCRVVLSVEATYTSLGLAGSAKDLIRGGFCSSRMLTQLPQCGVKRYQRPNWPYTTEVKRLRSGFRIETLYYWTSVDREKITAALGLPPDSLERAESGPAVGRPLPVLVKALTKKYPALVVKAEQVSRDGRRRQILYFNGSLADIVKSGLLTADALALYGARGLRLPHTYTEYGDTLYVSENADGTYRGGIFTDYDKADADDDRRSSSKKLQTHVGRLLRPFVRGTWAPPAKP